jgi:DNA polymerase I-like protein with 3'-5' exonuclease and polymerase domains
LYVDYAQQEFGIAAALSKDDAMQKAYYAEDPYLSFAIQAGAAPQGATKATHGDVRNCFKQCTLATQYGMGAQSLALRIGKSQLEAQTLLDTHKRLYERYWAWSEGAVSYASLFGKIETVFGWRLLTTPTTTLRTIQNFPMQANGAEILRVACCYLTEAGIRVAAPVHDAVLVECPIEDIDATTSEVQFILAKASRVVLGGFTLKTDITTTKYPAVLSDSDSSEIWATIQRVLSH